MVTYADVGRRFLIYAIGLLEVILFAEYTLVLTLLLLANIAVVRWHMKTPYTFSAVAMAATPFAAALCVKLNHHTWWYAHGMGYASIPPWLCPMHGLVAHWALDLYWLVSLRDVRKATLP